MAATPDAVMRQWFKEVWNERNPEAIDKLMSADARVHGLAGVPIIGASAFKPFHKTFCDSFNDFQIEITQSLVDGDRVAVLCHVTGKHDGDALGGKATQQPIDFWGMTMGRIENGQIVEGWNTFDFLTMYQQLGWVKTPVAG